MAAEQLAKRSMIRQIVRIRQMLRRWRQKAAESRKSVPSDVPAGHVAVTVGVSGRRFVVRATHFNHPIFHSLLNRAEEEFGFANRVGPIYIPCDEIMFEEIIRFLTRPGSSTCCLEDFQTGSGLRAISETRPLLT